MTFARYFPMAIRTPQGEKHGRAARSISRRVKSTV
jgi:hypothetical protein